MTWKKISSFYIYDQHISGDHKDCLPGTSSYWNSCQIKLDQLRQQHADGNHKECKDVSTVTGITWDQCSYKYIFKMHNGETWNRKEEHAFCDNSCEIRQKEKAHHQDNHRDCIPQPTRYYGVESWKNCAAPKTVIKAWLQLLSDKA